MQYRGVIALGIEEGWGWDRQRLWRWVVMQPHIDGDGNQGQEQWEQMLAHEVRLGDEDAPDCVVTTSADKTLQGSAPQ